MAGRQPAWFEGLRRAPVVLLAYASPTYLARYAEADKADSGLGAGAEPWPVPYWYGDAAFGVMAVLLGAVDAGLGACILGAFRGEAAGRAARRPRSWRLFCAVSARTPRRERSPVGVARAPRARPERKDPPGRLGLSGVLRKSPVHALDLASR